MGWTTGVQFPTGAMLEFHFATASRPVLGCTQPLIQWAPGILLPKIKRLGREDDHSPPCKTEVKNTWSYTSIPPIRLQGMVLGTQEQLYLTLSNVMILRNLSRWAWMLKRCRVSDLISHDSGFESFLRHEYLWTSSWQIILRAMFRQLCIQVEKPPRRGSQKLTLK